MPDCSTRTARSFAVVIHASVSFAFFSGAKLLSRHIKVFYGSGLEEVVRTFGWSCNRRDHILLVGCILDLEHG
jgi:hypothetical protein